MKPLWLVLLAGLLLRVCVLLLPWDVLLSRWGSDDLFYYSQIAGRIASGQGVTFDGIHPTNGFQPLFLAMLVPFGKYLLNNPSASVYVTLCLCSALTLLAAWQLMLLMKQAGFSALSAVFSGAVLSLHPKVLGVTFNGTEAALSLLVLTLALRAFFWLEKKQHAFPSSLIFTALVLTRMDFVLFLAILFVFAMLRKQSPGLWIQALLLPAIVFAIWMFLNNLVFEDYMPSSGRAKSIAGTHFQISIIRTTLSTWKTALLAESRLSWLSLGLFVAGIGTLLKSRSPLLPHLGAWFAGSTAMSAIAVWQLHAYRDWYLMPHYLLAAVLIGNGLSHLWERFGKYRWGLFAVPLILWMEANAHPRNFFGNRVLESAARFRTGLPPGARIASFNAGMVSCALGPEFTVLNIDGVVNNQVLPFLAQRRLAAYMQENRIAYLIDFEDSIEAQIWMFGAESIPMKTIAALPVYHTKTLVLLKLPDYDRNR